MLTNSELVLKLKELTQKERELTTEILRYLREVDERKIHLEMGYPDLYSFARAELGYAEGSAYRRIAAMRLIKTLPALEEKIESGELSLSNAAQAQSHLRKEEKARKNRGVASLSPDAKSELVSSLIGVSTREGERILAEQATEKPAPEEKIKALAGQKTLIQFIATAELMEKLEKLKHLLAHQNFEGRMDVLIEKLAEIALKKLDPESQPAQTPTPGKAQTVKTRYIPRHVIREIWRRDEGRCTYRDPESGKACGNRHALQPDHRQPYSKGGKNTVENLTLRCGAHNRYLAEKQRLGRSPASGKRTDHCHARPMGEAPRQ